MDTGYPPPSYSLKMLTKNQPGHKFKVYQTRFALKYPKLTFIVLKSSGNMCFKYVAVILNSTTFDSFIIYPETYHTYNVFLGYY